VAQLSPAYSEPQLWSSYLDDNSAAVDYFNYAHQHLQQVVDFTQELDSGFTISSSSRPFHGASYLSAQCNTWPNDSTDFSWSQIQVILIIIFS
jgi:hypothetical protein